MAAFSVPNAAATAKITARAMPMSSLPMGSHASLSLRSRASRSVPPVVAPCWNTSPRDSPMSTPPNTHASMGSMGCQSCSGVSASMNTDEMNMVYSDDTSSRPPMSFQPSRNSGMFSIITVTPTGAAGTRQLIIWATPVTPPKAMPLGA